MKMNFNVPHANWVEVPESGDRQVSNQGSVPIRVAKSATAPTNDNDGVIVSTYSQAYATIFIDSDTYWAKGIGGNSVINVQSV
jgi:hypothetical protein